MKFCRCSFPVNSALFSQFGLKVEMCGKSSAHYKSGSTPNKLGSLWSNANYFL